jgi:hypothetical protein
MTISAHESKLAQRFTILDGDGDGYIQKSDLDAMAARVCERLVPGNRPAVASEIRAGYSELWRQLAEFSGGAERISAADWPGAMEAVLSDPARYDATVKRINVGVFHATDLDGNGHLDRNEVTLLLRTLGWEEPGRADAVFTALDLNGDGMVTLDEYLEVVHDFWTGDDADSPSSRLLGDLL